MVLRDRLQPEMAQGAYRERGLVAYSSAISHIERRRIAIYY